MSESSIKLTQETKILIQAVLDRCVKTHMRIAINIPIIMVNNVSHDGQIDTSAEIVPLMLDLRGQLAQIKGLLPENLQEVDKRMSGSEAARYLGVSGPTLAKYIKEGKISAKKIGKKYSIMQSELDRFIRSK